MPTTLPAGHGAMSKGPRELSAPSVSFVPPKGWIPMPKRPMTKNVYSLPRAAGDSEDAQVAVSMLGRMPPWEMNVARWCAQFDLPNGKDCAEAAQQRTLDGTKHPTRLVDITGTYKGGSSMMGQPTVSKPDYRMIAAEIRAGTTPWYVKLTGPVATVAQHEDTFLAFVREAK
jgi:hypothetical protein